MIARLCRVALALFRLRLAILRGLGFWPRPASADGLPAVATLFRRELEALGGTYIKLGQFLALRRDLLSPALCDELLKLLDQVPPFPDALARAIIAAEFGETVDTLFAEFPDEPVAAASFAQVYRARLADGRHVAVKVQRPGMTEQVAIDLKALGWLCRLVDGSTLLGAIKVQGIFDDFRRWTLEELDFKHEARMASRATTAYAADKSMVIPGIHWGLTSRRVLTTDFLEGTWLSDVLRGAPRPAGIDGTTLARRLLHGMMFQIFEADIFHADPHAGNLVVLPDGRIGFVDFGITGLMTEDFKRCILKLLKGIAASDGGKAFSALAELVNLPPRVDRQAFRQRYEENLQRWIGAFYDPTAAMHERSHSRLFLDNLDLLRVFGVPLPATVVRFYRAFIIIDPILLELDPKFHLINEMKGYLTELHRRQASHSATVADIREARIAYRTILLRAPEVIAELFGGRDNAIERIESLPHRIGAWIGSLISQVGVLCLMGGGAIGFILWVKPSFQQTLPFAEYYARPEFAAGLLAGWLACGYLGRWIRFRAA